MIDCVMVCAYANEPVRLNALSVGTDYVIVAGQDLTKTIGFPMDCVYRYEQELFERLRLAFKDGDADTLTQLWDNAEPYIKDRAID